MIWTSSNFQTTHSRKRKKGLGKVQPIEENVTSVTIDIVTDTQTNMWKWGSTLLGLGVFDTLSDSIQSLNFAKKNIHSMFESILLYPRLNSKYYSIRKNSADSIQKIIQFISQGIIDTGRMGKVPKNYLKNVQNRLKKGLFIKNGKYRFKIWFIHSFHDKIQFKGLFNINFLGIFNSKKYSIIFFHRKFNSKIDSKILIWIDPIQ